MSTVADYIAVQYTSAYDIKVCYRQKYRTYIYCPTKVIISLQSLSLDKTNFIVMKMSEQKQTTYDKII